ncbi:GPW/gp25 family protein [Chitiniphilus purpureus]|uniref:GPW/gp25 family protein n=1 Tax=Chitiniphilus purpureus TaxID=2981137 RepID=A0ABY6DK26_9NEIS|nr:GPW/gp25 family protein [Chitiniphilus sp. CD1]UXY14682.1 GPW/gp25 family protein [Chitiniphilus sp. CD1]
MSRTSRLVLGAGLGLPLAPDGAGRLPVVDGPEKVRQSIAILLDTEPGERLMLPDYGCGLRRFLMQTNSALTRAQIQREVRESLKRWEPRIAVGDVAVVPGRDPSLVLVQIDYTHLRDGSRDNLVYPFYLA